MDDQNVDQLAYDGLVEYAKRLEDLVAALEKEVAEMEEENRKHAQQSRELSALLSLRLSPSPPSSPTTTRE